MPISSGKSIRKLNSTNLKGAMNSLSSDTDPSLPLIEGGYLHTTLPFFINENEIMK